MTANGNVAGGETPVEVSTTVSPWLTSCVAGNRRSMHNDMPTLGLIDSAAYDKAFKQLEDTAGSKATGKIIAIHIKEPGPKQSKPGNWKENEITSTRQYEQAIKYKLMLTFW
jgi:hypothetical protein